MGLVYSGVLNLERTDGEDRSRNYAVDFLVERSDDDETLYRPSSVATVVGIPQTGDALNLPDEVDLNAFCQPAQRIRRRNAGDPGAQEQWVVSRTFSTPTKRNTQRRCGTTTFDNPLTEPRSVKGGFTKTSEEAQYTSDDPPKPITNSAHEFFKGELLTRRKGQPYIELEANYASINLTLVAGLLESTNVAAMWGLAENTIAFTDFSWEELLYGSCFKYFPVAMRFDISLSTWATVLTDEGTRKLIPGGDKTNPDHFVKATDKAGNEKKIWLDGNGNEVVGVDAEPVKLTFQIPPKKNLLLLGIPDPLF